MRERRRVNGRMSSMFYLPEKQNLFICIMFSLETNGSSKMTYKELDIEKCSFCIIMRVYV